MHSRRRNLPIRRLLTQWRLRLGAPPAGPAWPQESTGRAWTAARTLAAACLLAAVSGFCIPSAQASHPARVVTLAPHITEMVFAAGAGQTLAGTVVSSDYPAAARALPRVGDGAAAINTEALIRLKPDLVLAWHRSGAVAATAPLLQSLGIPLELIAPLQLDDIPDQIEALGKRLGTPDAASGSAASLRDTLRSLRSRYAHRPTVSVFIEIGHTPLYGVGKDALLNDALRACGGINIFQDSTLAALPIGPEHILQKRPQIILASALTPEHGQQAQARWAAFGLSAQNGVHVHGINPDTLFRPGPRLIAATVELCRVLEAARPATQYLKGSEPHN